MHSISPVPCDNGVDSYLPCCQPPNLPIPPEVGHDVDVEQILDVCDADGDGGGYDAEDEELGCGRIGEAGG